MKKNLKIREDLDLILILRKRGFILRKIADLLDVSTSFVLNILNDASNDYSNIGCTMQMEKLKNNDDIRKCNIDDIIIMEYLNGKKFSFQIIRIENNKLICKEDTNYIQEKIIDLEYRDYIKEIVRIY